MSGWRTIHAIALAAGALLLGACAGGGLAPVETVTTTRAPARTATPVNASVKHYTVRAGDTLYAISWTFGLTSWQELAALNKIRWPYTIYPGQRLRVSKGRTLLRRPTTRSRPAPAPAPRSTKPAKARPPAKVAKPPKVAPRKPTTVARGEPSKWVWPASGPIGSSFGPNNKGLDIKISAGRKVVAAAAGDVVYAGRGIRGLGLLVIVRHTDKLLSAYSSGGRILANEGTKVRAGDALAASGDPGSLHFEVRRDGRPINPISLLPKR